MAYKNIFGKRLKEYRERIGITQEELAKKVKPKMKTSQISLIECGKSKQIYLSTALRILTALDVSFDSFIVGAE